MPLDATLARILVVDDEPFMLRLLVRMLARLGLTQVTACESGQRAMEQVNGGMGRVDLIFLDINMPGMDGVEFIRQLSERRFQGAVVLLSGETDRILESIERLIEAHRLRCLGRLHKPVALEHIQSLIERWQQSAELPRPVHTRPGVTLQQLRSAIERKELINHYQPKVSLATRQLVGVECLVRWQPAEGALIYPDQFIPLAEEYGLVGQITRAVLGNAMRHAKAWSQAGIQLDLAVNVSMADLMALDFPDYAAALAQSIGIEPGTVTLEVTESRIMRHLSTALDVLSRLRLKRFRLAIDDFGTGHSSLAQLRDLPFDELKIDRSFVNGASSNTTLRAICDASLRMAQQLQLHTVAEGIEQPEDWVLLRELGCAVGQGYLIARPMPLPELASWSTKWNSDAGAAHSPESA